MLLRLRDSMMNNSFVKVPAYEIRGEIRFTSLELGVHEEAITYIIRRFSNS